MPKANARIAALPSREVGALVRTSDDKTCDNSGMILAASWQKPKTWSALKATVLMAGEGRTKTPDIRFANNDRANPCVPLSKAPRRSLAGFRWACALESSACEKEVEVAIGWQEGRSRESGPRFVFRRSCLM